METTEAIERIEGTILKPGWRIEAEDHSKRFEGTVKLTVHYPAANSNRENAPDYTEQILPDTHASFALQVGLIADGIELYRRLIDVMVNIETHEWREFLRDPRTLDAPFHPHRIEGMTRWGDVEGDLHFGLA